VRYHALACDYDGTIAHDGRVDAATEAALERVAASGRRLILVTGRELPDLQRAFPRLGLFERVVAENGGLLYRPATREERLLTEPADPRLVARLQAEEVTPLSVGRAIVATSEPNDPIVLAAIRDLGLELEIIFNKGAVMVLPTGVTKASGLQAALLEMGLSAHDVVGVGDAENDHAFLTLCEISAAVSNALPTLKDRADLVLDAPRGEGVARLVARILDDDLAALDESLARHRIGFGETDEPFVGPTSPRSRVLIAGTSGGGKSTLVTAFFERLVERAYQVCLIDPEGDYEHLRDAVVLGRADRPPTVEEVSDVLTDPARSVVVNLLGLPVIERPAFFETMLARIVELRARTGRPHWLIADEAHHLLPSDSRPKERAIAELEGLLLVTVHPEQVAASIVGGIDLAISIGAAADQTIGTIAGVLERAAPGIDGVLADGDALAWLLRRDRPDDPGEVVRFRPARPTGEKQRHRRKYAEGELNDVKSFWFRGPDGRLNLRAQNLTLFVQLGEGVDDETWLHHLHRGDYSRWIRESISDPELASEIAGVEEDAEATAMDSRRRIRESIEERYTAPAG
jgi:HAD superfamily hydrolase (TIGR01484 family)